MKPPTERTLRVTLQEHFSSMGLSHSYKHRGIDRKVHNSAYGLPLANLFDLPLGEGATFEVTVKVIKRGRRGKNPWRK